MRLSLLFSDTELGGGNRSDDFLEEGLFCDALKGIFDDAKKNPCDLIFNGDTFDFIKCPLKDGSYPRHFTEKRSVEKFGLIKKAHPKFFKIITLFLKLRPDNRVIFIYGNHDYDLFFPLVQKAITKAIAGNDLSLQTRILYPGFEFRDNLLFVEHGSQMDYYFKVHPEKFVHPGNIHFPEPFLMIPWGHNALYEFYMEYKERYPVLERLLPREFSVAGLPRKLRFELMFGTIWYVLKSFFYTQFVEWHDPLRRFHPSVFTRYVTKFMKRNFHLDFLHKVRAKLRKSSIQIFAIGHNHTGTIHTFRGRRIINTGTWRDEYLYNPEIDAFLPKMKSYGYVLHDEKKVHIIELREVSSKQEVIFFEDISEKFLSKMRYLKK